MGLFKDILADNQTLFKNEIALDYDFLPKLMPYREYQQKYVVQCIKPLLDNKNGKNVFIFGAPGIGKTTAIRFVLRDLEEETEEVIPIYINCWQRNTSYKIVVEICNILGYKLTMNKKTDELFDIAKNIVNKSCAVFVLDEVDKLEDIDLLYSILESIYKKSVVLITNFKEWLEDLDERVKSRLMSDMLEFKPYNLSETRGILKQRMGYAFVPNCFSDEAFELIVNKTADLEDIRTGLHLMKQAGNNAEKRSSRKIEKNDAEEAIKKLDEFSIKSSVDLPPDERSILNIVKEVTGKKIGDLYLTYKKRGGNLVYRSFQRKIEKLRKGKFIYVERKMGGEGGTTTIIHFKDPNVKLDEF